MSRHEARIEVGSMCYLRTWSSSVSSAAATTNKTEAMCVLGCVVATRQHAEDNTRCLYYFRATHVVEHSNNSDAVYEPVTQNNKNNNSNNGSAAAAAAASSQRRVMSLSSALRGGASASERSELTLHHHTLTSTQGYVYSYDGWYDADDLCRTHPYNNNSNNHGMTTMAAAAAADGVPDDWLDAMEKSSAACELRYVCYTMRPWFDSPFDTLGYLALAERDRCYSVYVCHRCLCVFFSAVHLSTHLAGYCAQARPPGVLLYHDRDTHRRVYLVDGAQHLHYARCLCLLGKCFIESKLLHNDVDLYEFFVVTMPRASLPYVAATTSAAAAAVDGGGGSAATAAATAAARERAAFRRAAATFDCDAWAGDVVTGYFSRLKQHADHALSCIVTLPPFQRLRMATFMLDMAYYLTRERQRQCGCAAHCGGAGGAISRPFSPLGHALLLSYWRAALRRGAWRRVLHTRTCHAHGNVDDKTSGDDNAGAAAPSTYTLRSVDEVRQLMDVAVHVDDVVYLLTHDNVAYYATRRRAPVLHEGDGSDTATAAAATAGGGGSSTVVSLVFDTTTQSSACGASGGGDGDGNGMSSSSSHRDILATHGDEHDDDNGDAMALRGRFHIKWVCKDATGAPLYTRALYHY